MNLTGKKVAILVANYFEQAEFEKPKQALEDAGVEVQVISPTETPLQAMNSDVNKGDTFQRDLDLADADASSYDALVLPGGTVNADTLRQDKQAQAFAKDMLESGKPVAAICHAPWLLVSADVVDERKLTSYPSLQDDIRNGGGSWTNDEVVIDDNLITSRTPDDLPAFDNALLKALARVPAAHAH